MNPSTRLDDLRAAHPTLGFAVYAYEPGGPVTLELHDGEDSYSFTAETTAAAFDLAFPAPATPTLPDIFG